MTVPIERFNTIKYTQDFLYSLLDPKRTPRVPKEIRMRARSLLKHFPQDYEMEAAQKKAPGIWGTRGEK